MYIRLKLLQNITYLSLYTTIIISKIYSNIKIVHTEKDKENITAGHAGNL